MLRVSIVAAHGRGSERVVMSEPGLRDFKHGSGVVEPLGGQDGEASQISIDDRLKVEPCTRPLVVNGSREQTSFDGIGVYVID